jgi:hypothetical protein
MKINFYLLKASLYPKMRNATTRDTLAFTHGIEHKIDWGKMPPDGARRPIHLIDERDCGEEGDCNGEKRSEGLIYAIDS